MVELKQLVQHCNDYLQISAIDDYCPNGLQVDAGVSQINSIVTGVTASQALIDAATAHGADLLLVHHGYFWKGESMPLTGIKGQRIRSLFESSISLMAYHLPLDMHPELGNNRQLATRLGFDDAAPAESGDGHVWVAELPVPESVGQIAARISGGLGREPLHLPGGTEQIRRVGWCTGAAEGYIVTAADLGLDAFISGEVSEQTTHLAQELGVHYFAAGHHATEKFGVAALGEYLASKFGVEHRFVDVPNPV